MLGCDTSTADDLTQETFLRVLGKADFVHLSPAASAVYLRRTAHNLLVSMLRRNRREQLRGSFQGLDDLWNRWAGADLVGDESLDALRQCVKLLTERAQLALRLRYVEEASRISIGAALGISDHGARNLMQRAKTQLRDCLQQRLQTTHAKNQKAEPLDGDR